MNSNFSRTTSREKSKRSVKSERSVKSDKSERSVQRSRSNTSFTARNEVQENEKGRLLKNDDDLQLRKSNSKIDLNEVKQSHSYKQLVKTISGV